MSFISDKVKADMMASYLSGKTYGVALIDADVQVPLASNAFLSEIDPAAMIAQATLSNVSITDNVFDADDVIFPNVSGTTAEGILIYIDTGDPTTSTIVSYIDSGAGLPITLNGTDVNIVWGNDAVKIFKL